MAECLGIPEWLSYLIASAIGAFGCWVAMTRSHRDVFFKERLALYKKLFSAASEMYVDAFLFLVLEDEEDSEKLSKSAEVFRNLLMREGLMLSEKVGGLCERLHSLSLEAKGKSISEDDLKAEYENLVARLRKELRLSHLSVMTTILLPSFPFTKADQREAKGKNHDVEKPVEAI